MRAAIYARISTRDKGQDIQNQLRQLRRFCASQRWRVVGEYIDRASGKSSDRDEFKRLFVDASQRKFDLVLFWALDRFSREGVRETLNHLERLTGYGINWRSFTEQYLDSCGIFRDAVLAILAVIAKQERVRLSERTRAGLERARAQGRRLGRPPLVVNRERAVKLHKQGKSLSQIAAALKVSKTSAYRLVQAH